MADNPAPQNLTPKELEEVQEFFRKKQLDIQVTFTQQKVRRLDDGGILIDPPAFQTRIVKIKLVKIPEGNGKIEVA